MNVRGIFGTASGLSLAGLMLAHFTNDLYANFLPSFLPVLQANFGLSYTLVAALLSAFTTGASFFQLLFGYLVDRIASLRFSLIGPLLTGLFMSTVGILPSYEWILGALLLSAMGTAMFHPQAAAISGRLFASRKGLYVSLFIASGTLGFALGPAVMGLFIDRWGLERAPWALLLLVALGALIWMLQRDAGRAGRPNSGSAASQVPTRAQLRPYLRPLSMLWALVVLRHTVLLAYVGFLVILLGQRGADYLAGNFALFAFLLAAAIGGLAGGHLSDRWGRWPVLVVAMWAGFFALIGFLLTGGAPSFVLLLLGGCLLNASNPVIVTYAQELVPDHAGTASAIVMGFAWGTAGLLVNLVGVLADAWQNVALALGVFVLVAFVLTALLTVGRVSRGLSGAA